MSTDERDDDFWRRPPEPEEAPESTEEFDPFVADPGAAGGVPDERPVLPKGAPGRLQRLSGTLAVAALVVVGALFAVSNLMGSAASTPGPTPTPTSTITPVTIPDEARTKVYRSDTQASNEFRAATLTLEPATTAKNTNPYTVRVETTANIDADEAARAIQSVLDDPRGWAGFGNNNFRLVADTEQAKLTITIASPATTDALCGPKAKTAGLYSCRVDDAIVINSDRWHYMTPTFNNIDEYRAYAINHQVGKFLGQRIAFCTKKGEPSPAMAQQDTNLDGCLPNAWPKLT